MTIIGVLPIGYNSMPVVTCSQSWEQLIHLEYTGCFKVRRFGKVVHTLNFCKDSKEVENWINNLNLKPGDIIEPETLNYMLIVVSNDIQPRKNFFKRIKQALKYIINNDSN